MSITESHASRSSAANAADPQQVVREGLLDPDLDIEALALAFAAEGRLQIEQALRPRVADALHDCLASEVPWFLAFRDRDGDRKLDPATLEAMDDEERRQLDAEITALGREAFQFRYDSFMMVTAYKDRVGPALLHRVVEQLNMPPWLDALRAITALDGIRRTDAQATRYRAGHFLRTHDDIHEGEGRLAAYVINLTRDWRPDWGGLLQFGDETRDIETYYPRFNSISLFAVPATHWVSPVAPFATGERLAITGWLRR